MERWPQLRTTQLKPLSALTVIRYLQHLNLLHQLVPNMRFEAKSTTPLTEYDITCGAGGVWPTINGVCEPQCPVIAIANSDANSPTGTIPFGDGGESNADVTVTCTNPGFTMRGPGIAAGSATYSKVFTCKGGNGVYDPLRLPTLAYQTASSNIP